MLFTHETADNFVHYYDAVVFLTCICGIWDKMLPFAMDCTSYLGNRFCFLERFQAKRCIKKRNSEHWAPSKTRPHFGMMQETGHGNSIAGFV